MSSAISKRILDSIAQTTSPQQDDTITLGMILLILNLEHNNNDTMLSRS